GPEELALVARAGAKPDGTRRQRRRDALGLGNRLAQPLVPGLSNPLRVTDRALDGGRREPARDEVVPSVPVGDLDAVARHAELVHHLEQDDLHRCSYRVVYARSAISRAFFTAVATSRWCCAQLPVTRLARIFPRS